MKNKMKQLFGIILSLVLVLGLMPGMRVTVNAENSYNFKELTLADLDGKSDFNEVFNALGGLVSYSYPDYNSLPAPSSDSYVRLIIGISNDPEYLRVRIYNNGTVVNPNTSVSLNNGSIKIKENMNSGIKFYYIAPVSVNNVSLNKSSTTLTAGKTEMLTATVLPDNATDKTVKWSVGGTNPGAVKLYTDADCITEVGTAATDKLTVYAKGISAGSATVTCTSKSDSNKSASCDMTVNRGVPAIGDFTYSAPSDLTYDGTAKEATVVGASGMGQVTVKYYSDEECTAEVTPTNVGTYYVGITVSEGDNYSEVSTVLHDVSWQFSISKQDAPASLNDDQKPTAKTGLTYTGNEQELVTAPVSIPTGYTVQYSLDGTNWSVDLPKGTNAGDYTVKVKYVGDGNHEDFNGTDIAVTIGKGTAPTLTDDQKPAAKTGLTYTGSDQALVTAPTELPVGYIEMQYALGTKDAATGTYSASIPIATDAGTYYVWYKVVGDSNHLDSDADYVTVTIATADSSNSGSGSSSSGSTDSGSGSSSSSGSSDSGNTSGGTSSDSSDNTNTNTDTSAKVPYDDVPISTGSVNDITGTAAATAESNPFSTKIENSSSLTSLLSLTDAEVAQGVNVWLDIQDISSTVSATDKNLISNASGDYKVGLYIDVNLFKKVGNNDAVKITETNGKIKFSIVIPESIRKSGRTFELIRLHDGKTTALTGNYDETTGKFTVETDQFSTYAIAYKDAASSNSTSTDSSSSDNTNSTTSTAPKTGDTNDIRVWYLLLIASLGGLGFLGLSKKKEN